MPKVDWLLNLMLLAHGDHASHPHWTLGRTAPYHDLDLLASMQEVLEFADSFLNECKGMRVRILKCFDEVLGVDEMTEDDGRFADDDVKLGAGIVCEASKLEVEQLQNLVLDLNGHGSRPMLWVLCPH